MKTTITTQQVSKPLHMYYRLFIDGKEVALIRYPSTNLYLKEKSLQEIAEITANRIINN